MKQNDLNFDIDKLNEMKTKLADIASELGDDKKKALDSFDKLKKDWNTAAGKNFMKNIDTDWTDEVDKYITIIEIVESLLEEAAAQYATVEEEIDKLKFY